MMEDKTSVRKQKKEKIAKQITIKTMQKVYNEKNVLCMCSWEAVGTEGINKIKIITKKIQI